MKTQYITDDDGNIKSVLLSYKKYLKFGLSLIGNLKEFYNLAVLEVKQKLIGSIFGGNLVFEKGKYRTTHLNETFALITRNINQLQELKSQKVAKTDDLFNLAPPPGLEPGTP